MAHSNADSKTSQRVGLLSGVMDRISARQLETLEIVTDVNQMSQLMNSLMEARSGQVISLDAAFGDL